MREEKDDTNGSCFMVTKHTIDIRALDNMQTEFRFTKCFTFPILDYGEELIRASIALNENCICPM